MLMIRLSRQGGHGRPFYHIVATDSRKPRDSGYIEKLGFFNPGAMGKDEVLRIDRDRTEYWLSHGGKMSERVKYLYKSCVNGKDLRAEMDERRAEKGGKQEPAANEAGSEAAGSPVEEAPETGRNQTG